MLGFGMEEMKKKVVIARKSYQLFSVSVLREYLALDMCFVVLMLFKFDLEWMFDDFIFMCFFVGNDFLLYLLMLEICEGVIDLLMTFYRNCFSTFGGYLCVDGCFNFFIVEKFVWFVSEYEDVIFQKCVKKEV